VTTRLSLLKRFAKNKIWFLPLAIVLLFAGGQQASFAADGVASTSPETLSPELQQIARVIGVWPMMTEISALQGQFRSEVPLNGGSTMADFAAYFGKRQKLLHLRQQQTQIMTSANLDVNSTRGRLESDMAQIQEAQAALVEKRARATRRNTIINFFSGGITKITGYSIALAGPDLPTNILEVVDGSIQCSLMGVTMKDLHDENRMVKEMPAMLVALNADKNISGAYSSHIWSYLNEEPLDGTGKASRREALADAWQSRGIFSRGDKASRLDRTNPRHRLTLARIAPQLLEDRMAMLSEVRSVVSNMHTSLMKLSEFCERSYNNDPSFEVPSFIDSTTQIR